MNVQEPAEGIAKIADNEYRKAYSVPCKCGCNEHTAVFEVSKEHRDDDDVSLFVYVTAKTSWQKNRFKHIWRLLTRGYIETEADVIITNQAAINLANIILKDFNDATK